MAGKCESTGCVGSQASLWGTAAHGVPCRRCSFYRRHFQQFPGCPQRSDRGLWRFRVLAQSGGLREGGKRPHGRVRAIRFRPQGLVFSRDRERTRSGKITFGVRCVKKTRGNAAQSQDWRFQSRGKALTAGRNVPAMRRIRILVPLRMLMSVCDRDPAREEDDVRLWKDPIRQFNKF